MIISSPSLKTKSSERFGFKAEVLEIVNEKVDEGWGFFGDEAKFLAVL